MPEEKRYEIVEKDDWDGMFDTTMNAMFVAAIVLFAIPMMPAMQSAQRYYTSQMYEGNVETRILNANSSLKYWDCINDSPYRPLISLFLINRGSSRVYLAINEAKDWLEIWPRETRTISHVGAQKRIEIIFYKCNIGEVSQVEAEGHY